MLSHPERRSRSGVGAGEGVGELAFAMANGTKGATRDSPLDGDWEVKWTEDCIAKSNVIVVLGLHVRLGACCLPSLRQTSREHY